jgi:superfamily II DNA or RNA helicase
MNQYEEFKINSNSRTMDDICKVSSFQKQKHQKFISKYFKDQQKNNPRVLLMHGLGSGKTCSSILISESVKTNHKVIVVVPAALQTNYRKELMSDCVSGNTFLKQPEKNTIKQMMNNKHYCELNVTQQKTYDNLMKIANKRINDKYEIMSYQKFVNRSEKGELKLDNKLVIIDEVQNIISITGSMYQVFLKELVFKRPSNLKLVLLSGTPMVDKAHELSLVLNLLDKGDKQLPEGDKFISKFVHRNSNGELSIKDELYEYVKNKVSFFAGVSPRAYPQRIDHDVICKMSNKQEDVYKKTIGNLTSLNNPNMIKKIFSQTFYISPRLASNAIYTNRKVGLSNRPKHLKASQIISSKFDTCYQRIAKSKGPVFVYSNFVSASGIKDFAVILSSKGYREVTPDICPIGSAKRFATFKTGEEKQNARILSIYNSTKNKDGSLIKVILGSPAMKEGVTLLRVREVHLLDPYWNKNRTEQIIGRAIRFCSHKDVSPTERLVDVYHYISHTSQGVLSVDQHVHKLAKSKNDLVDLFTKKLKQFAFDCSLFKSVNGVERCGRFQGTNTTIPRNSIHSSFPKQRLHLNNSNHTLMQKFQGIYREYDKIFKLDLYIYSKTFKITETFKNKIKRIFRNLGFKRPNNIKYHIVKASYKGNDDVLRLVGHKEPGVSVSEGKTTFKSINFSGAASSREIKRNVKGNLKTKGGCPKKRIPNENGICPSEFPHKAKNPKGHDCCYKRKHRNSENISSFKLLVKNDILYIGRKRCMSYHKPDLIKLAKKLKIVPKTYKADICKQIKDKAN